MGETAVRRVEQGDMAAIRRITLDAEAAGELPGWLRRELELMLDILPVAGEPALACVADGEIVGLFATGWPLVIVAPGARRRGYGRRLVEEAARLLAAEGLPVELAPPVGSEAAAAFARALGFAYDSSLRLMRLDPDVELPTVELPPGYAARAYDPSRDTRAYVALVNDAFRDSPVPMHVTVELIEQVHQRTGFDPGDILLATPAGVPDALAGFCRVTWLDQPEVSVLGVRAAHRGTGLGRYLLRWGVRRLRDQGAGAVYLTVEGRNELALGLYERAGFRRDTEWPRWRRH